jgi:hypothetical protein
MLRLGDGAKCLLLLAAHTPTVSGCLSYVKVADPNFAFAGAVDLLDPAFRRFGTWQVTSDTLDLELRRRYER